MSRKSQKKSIFLSFFVSASFLHLMTICIHCDADCPEPAAESTSARVYRQPVFVSPAVGNALKMIIIAVSSRTKNVLPSV